MCVCVRGGWGGGGVQRPFVNFPKIHLFWYGKSSHSVEVVDDICRGIPFVLKILFLAELTGGATINVK